MRPLNPHAELPSEARDLNFGRSLQNMLTLAMLNIFIYYTPPQFLSCYTCSISIVSMQFQSGKQCGS